MLRWGSCVALLAVGAGAAAAPAQHVNATSLEEHGVETAWLYGNINHYAYYFADIWVGTPPQPSSVIVDTGSRLVGFPCKGCAHCGSHLDPQFDVSASASATWQNCSRNQCNKGCQNGYCSYQETYSEGSTITGRWFDDKVSLGDVDEDKKPVNKPVFANLGCHTNENKLFYTQRANGIMGLAPSYEGSDGRPTFLQDLFRDKRHVDAQIFSICLADWGGRLTVGGYDISYHSEADIHANSHCSTQRPCPGDGAWWIDMTASHYYFIFPQGITLAGQPAASARDFGVTVVDSGTTFTYLPMPIFRSIVVHLKTYCKHNNGCGAKQENVAGSGLQGTGAHCWRLNNPAEGPKRFPLIKFQFARGVEVDWDANGYLYQRGQPGVWCQTFMPNSLFQTVLGISWMIHRDIIFDIKHGQLGVASAKCPEHHTKHGPGGQNVLRSAQLLEDGLNGLSGSSKGRASEAVGVAMVLVGAAGFAIAFWLLPRQSQEVGKEDSRSFPSSPTTAASVA